MLLLDHELEGYFMSYSYTTTMMILIAFQYSYTTTMTTLIFNSYFTALSTIISTLLSTRTIAIDRHPVSLATKENSTHGS